MAKLNDVITTLVTRWTALATPGGTLDGVLVFDGPPVTPASTMDLVIIGDDGGQDSGDQSTFEQGWVDLACTRREETGEVLCAAISSYGATDIRTRRDRVDVLLTACENDLRSDQTLGGVVYSATFLRGNSTGMQNTAGAAVVTPFTVRYRALA
jgi:hypothetical protein